MNRRAILTGMGESAGVTPEGPGTLDAWGLGPTPPGHRLDQRRIQLAAAFDPADPGLNRVFERARALLRAWAPQLGAGMRIDGVGMPPAVPEVGVEAVLRVRLAGLLPIAAPVRVTWTVDAPDGSGFAYEALPGHVTAGRESFVVTRETSAEGIAEVWFTVTAYSRPAAWYARIAAPAARFVQRRIMVRYLRAMAVAAR
jgi:uncharacterized protein (UPF0548 family)